MSINQSYAINEDKTRHLGKLFRTIDFEVVDGVDKTAIGHMPKSTIIGTFHIGGHVYPVTMGELDRIEETAIAARETFMKAYRLGLK